MHHGDAAGQALHLFNEVAQAEFFDIDRIQFQICFAYKINRLLNFIPVCDHHIYFRFAAFLRGHTKYINNGFIGWIINQILDVPAECLY
jgi:hypothetical protein